jgi:actin-related protein
MTYPPLEKIIDHIISYLFTEQTLSPRSYKTFERIKKTLLISHNKSSRIFSQYDCELCINTPKIETTYNNNKNDEQAKKEYEKAKQHAYVRNYQMVFHTQQIALLNSGEVDTYFNYVLSILHSSLFFVQLSFTHMCTLG